MKPDVQLFKTLIALQGDGSDVYEIVDGELCPRGDIEECEGEDIVATFDAWARSEEDLTVEKGSKALFWDDNKTFFHWFQVSDAGRRHLDEYDTEIY